MTFSKQISECLAIIEALKAYIADKAERGIIDAVRQDLLGKAMLLAPEELHYLVIQHSEFLDADRESPYCTLMKTLADHVDHLKSSDRRRGCLLFVHGIGSSCAITWDSMAALLRSHPDVSSYWDTDFFDYKTSKVKFWPQILGGSKNVPVTDLAKSLKGHIDRRCTKYDSVVIVAHSMGGLIAAKYLLNEKTDAQQHVRGAMFFATPWQGSQLATLATTISRLNWQARFMVRASPEVLETTEQFKKEASKFPHKLLFGGQDVAVTHEGMSTIFSMDNLVFLHDADHSTITQAAGYSSDNFIEIKTFLDSVKIHQFRS